MVLRRKQNKKIFSICLKLLVMIATLSGCGAAPSENGDASRPDSQQSAEKAEATIPNETEGANNMESGTTSKNLVVYFSMPETSGKTIVPFVTSGGSGFSDAISTIEQMEPDADVITDGLSISSNLVQDSEQEIIKRLTNKRLIQ